MTNNKIILLTIAFLVIVTTIFFTVPRDFKKVDYVSGVSSSTGGTLVIEPSIFMKKWVWVNTKYADGTSISPKQEDKFSIKFKIPRTLEITTDCNKMGGEYVIKDDTIEITQVFSTLMACEDSQENEYTASLGEARKIYLTNDWGLVLELESEKGKGKMVFK